MPAGLRGRVIFGKGNRMKFPTYEDKDGTDLAEVGTDCISRQQAIDALRKLREEDIEDYGCEIPEGFNQDHLDRATFAIKQLPPIQPEITHEQAIDYLHSTGWMQEHDRQMMIDGAHRLTAQPEPHWIPVTEDTPTEDDDYWATFDAETGRFVDWASWYQGKWVVWIDDNPNEVSNVIAWCKPMEPYKGATE